MSLTIRPLFTFRRPRGWTVLGALLVSLCGASAQAQRFDWDSLTQLAQTRATQPYRANSDKLPAELASITYDQLRDIRFKTDQSVWRAQNLPFEVQFFHLGLYQTEPVRIHELNADGTVNHLPYRSADFDQGKNTFDTSRWGDLGHAGFRLHYPLNGQTYKDELVVFQGASYFRALGAGQQYGLSARGLAIDTVGGTGEEFPRFSEFWLQRPAAGATEVTVLALLESPRATGAYRFVIRPGQQTTTTVNARVFLRAGAGPVNTLGMAPLTSMFLSGENQPMRSDFRPEVHDSDGLMMVTGEGEWLWRPLQRPKAVTVSSFAMQNPRGFGLMQRDRSFASYEDVEARYERRPSAWIKPLGDWGPGRVELVQLPTPDETHDNIVAYWVPQRLPARKLYIQGLIVGGSNPKALLFFTAFFPQFLDPTAAWAPQFAVLASTFVAFEFTVLTLCALGVARLAPVLRSGARMRWFNRISGGLFTLMGTLLLATRRAT